MQERLFNEDCRGQKIGWKITLFGKIYNKVIPIHNRNDQEMPESRVL